MARRSSPWWKLRWSRNSWPEPEKRDGFRPPTKPGNDFCQWSVKRSSFSRNAWSMSGACCMSIVYLKRCLCSLGGYALENTGEYAVRRLAVGVGVEVQNNSVAKDRRCHRPQVVCAHV